jgi:hypothetical protein
MKLFLATVLCALLCLPVAAEETKHLTDISDAKTACLVNRGTDLKMMDDVREKLQQWGRWKLISNPDEADILLLLSNEEIASGSVGTVASGNYAAGNTNAVGLPLVIQKVFISVVDRQSGTILTFVSAIRRRHLISGLPAYLVGSLKSQIEKHESRNVAQ